MGEPIRDFDQLEDLKAWSAECREDPEIQARTAAIISRMRSGNYTKVPVADRFKRPST